MIQTVIPMPVYVSHSTGTSDSRMLLAVFISFFVFFIMLWAGGWIYRKVTHTNENFAEFFGVWMVGVLACVLIICLMAETIYQLI